MSFNVLIVDDSELVRTSLRRLIALTVATATIREAGSLSEALVDVQRCPPILVILDLKLPDGFGWNIIQPVKEIAPASRIAIFTMLADPEHRQRCMTLGAQWFFGKGTGLGPLLDVVRQLAKLTSTSNPSPGNPNE